MGYFRSCTQGEPPASATRRRCPLTLPHVPQKIIAELVGTTPSRVNAFLGKFKRLGLIEDDDGVLVITPSLLKLLPDRD